jgi:hypothetical protein
MSRAHSFDRQLGRQIDDAANQHWDESAEAEAIRAVIAPIESLPIPAEIYGSDPDLLATFSVMEQRLRDRERNRESIARMEMENGIGPEEDEEEEEVDFDDDDNEEEEELLYEEGDRDEDWGLTSHQLGIRAYLNGAGVEQMEAIEAGVAQREFVLDIERQVKQRMEVEADMDQAMSSDPSSALSPTSFLQVGSVFVGHQIFSAVRKPIAGSASGNASVNLRRGAAGGSNLRRRSSVHRNPSGNSTLESRLASTSSITIPTRTGTTTIIDLPRSITADLLPSISLPRDTNAYASIPPPPSFSLSDSQPLSGMERMRIRELLQSTTLAHTIPFLLASNRRTALDALPSQERVELTRLLRSRALDHILPSRTIQTGPINTTEDYAYRRERLQHLDRILDTFRELANGSLEAREELRTALAEAARAHQEQSRGSNSTGVISEPIANANAGSTDMVSDDVDESWKVKIWISSVNSKSIGGYMTAFGVPSHSVSPAGASYVSDGGIPMKSLVTTYFVGEIIDPSGEDKLWGASGGETARKHDHLNWSKLGPFKGIESERVKVGMNDSKWLEQKCRGWVLMRWKEIDFVNVSREFLSSPCAEHDSH